MWVHVWMFGCRKNHLSCGPGCRCTSCKNNEDLQTGQDCNGDSENDLKVEVDGIMKTVIGECRATDEEREVTENEEDLNKRKFHMGVDGNECDECF